MKEIVKELVDSIDVVVGDQERSQAIARSILQTFGGMQIYLPLPKRAFREEDALAIYEAYDGSNAREVCRQFKITSNVLYTTIRSEIARRRRKGPKHLPSELGF